MNAALIRFLRDRSGVAAIEAALVLPILLALIAGIFEFSRVLLAQHMIRDVVDETARAAVVTGMTDAETLAQLVGDLDNVPIISDYAATAATAAGTLSVSVDVEFDLLFTGFFPQDMINFAITVQYPVSGS